MNETNCNGNHEERYEFTLNDVKIDKDALGKMLGVNIVEENSTSEAPKDKETQKKENDELTKKADKIANYISKLVLNGDWSKIQDYVNFEISLEEDGPHFWCCIDSDGIQYDDEPEDEMLEYHHDIPKSPWCSGSFTWRKDDDAGFNAWKDAGGGVKYCSDRYPKLRKVDEPPKKDDVNHPEHYIRPGAMECIEEMEAIFGVECTVNYCVLAAWKYRYRAGYKGNFEKDMSKSDWYLKHAKELMDKHPDVFGE